MITVSDQDLVLAYKCNEVIDFSLSRGESIDDIDTDHTVHVICTEYTSEPFKEVMADHIKLMNDYPMNKAKPVGVSDKDLLIAYECNNCIDGRKVLGYKDVKPDVIVSKIYEVYESDDLSEELANAIDDMNASHRPI